MSSMGSQGTSIVSSCGGAPPPPPLGLDERGLGIGGRGCGLTPVGGGLGVKGPSSRSFSYTIIVPSACETRNREAEPGTHRTQVHGELEIEPYRKSVSTSPLEYAVVRSALLYESSKWDMKHLFIDSHIARTDGIYMQTY